MALWLVRGGRQGEYENKFLEEKRIYLTWDGLNRNLGNLKDQRSLFDLLVDVYPDDSMPRLRNFTGQIWSYTKKMKIGDWVVMPGKGKSTVHFAEIKGGYIHDPNAEDPYFHYRDVEWFAMDIPRSTFSQDLLHSMGAFLTICQVKRNDAEKRIKAIAKSGWKSETAKTGGTGNNDDAPDPLIDLEQLAFDQIANHLSRRFKGHGMERIIEAVLKAKGYTTYRSPAGPDKGVDLLAAPGPLGFGNPRICVQVKSGDTPVDRPTLDQLIGTMQNFQAEQGLLVSWGGFKRSVDREVARQFFRVRLWNRDTIIQELMNNYDCLDEEIRVELPLKRVWTLAVGQDD